MVFPEPLNDHDRHAVCIKKDDVIVRHVPREQAKMMWHFLMHGGQVSCEVTGRRKLGNGLEVPCTYKLTGREKLVNRMQELLSKQRPDPRVSLLLPRIFCSSFTQRRMVLVFSENSLDVLYKLLE